MGQRPRPKPKRLAAKLLAVRQALGMSQGQLAKALHVKASYQRVSEYENGVREPNLLVLLAYARAAHIPVEFIIDDELDLDDSLVLQVKT